ncbi:DUF4221 family protein [Cecembia calidifontis]|uniref:Uncharacterized protein DUF4221 n=1 Tax=Cecembia calidifontis TaxID=1187080 RepID=A0A4V2F6C4_9BACT|nr:DUF4221 family protein [Cecembia calidifontis]RZS95829.1 uncharacterized protein DUF4221 [Cecembia calidifontis]
MRYLYLLILVVMAFCKEKTEKNKSDYFSNLRFSADTVIIDPQDEIIYLKHALFGADISKDKKYLFNFNAEDNTVEKINLDELVLEEKLPFDKEGPNGTGAYIGTVNVQNGNQITFNGINQTALFSLDGKKLMTVFLENFSLGGHTMKSWEELRPNRILDTASSRLYGLIYSIIDKSLFLGILHLDEYEISKMEMKTFENLPKFIFTFSSPNVISTILPGMGIEKFDTNLIISNQITNALILYNTELDTLIIKSFNSQLTANEKVKEYQLEHETDESFEREYGRFHQEINFLPPFWDEKNQIFYRFSYRETASENNQDEEAKSKVYLTAFDKELNQIGETFVPKLTKKPAKHFAKDGKIWIYENINDEMGFVVLTMSK